jgi:hypothetical protein
MGALIKLIYDEVQDIQAIYGVHVISTNEVRRNPVIEMDFSLRSK